MICSPTLDVHIALIPTVPNEWVTQCISSVVHAASLAGFTVTVNVFNGIVGHIGNTRQLGYSLGNGKYVTYVDCDDTMCYQMLSHV